MQFTQVQLDKLFIRLRQTKEELLYDFHFKEVLRYKLHQNGNSVLAVAHCDFVESAWSYPEYFDNGTKIRAGQVDDRVGVWLLLDVFPEIPGMPAFDYLLTTDEEIGQSSAQEVEEDLDYNWTFQFDRRGTDFVDYDKASRKFINAFSQATGIPHGVGSFSDICYLPDSCGSRVNIGTGYHNEHSPDAWVDLIECADQVERFVKFAQDYAGQRFAVKKPHRRKPGSGRYWQEDLWYLPPHGETELDINGMIQDATDAEIRESAMSNEYQNRPGYWQ